MNLRFPKRFVSWFICLCSIFLSASNSSAFWALTRVQAVGYVNTTLEPGLNLIHDPLLQETHLQGTPHFLGEAMGKGTKVSVFDGEKFITSTYDPETGFDLPLTIRFGEGFVVYNPLPTAVTVTFVGEIAQGTIAYDFSAGLHLVGSKIPQAGPVSKVLRMPPIACQVFVLREDGYKSYSYIPKLGWNPAEPVIAVGEAFWLRFGSDVSWGHEFFVNE